MWAVRSGGSIEDGNSQNLKVRRGSEGAGNDGMQRRWRLGELHVDPEF
jgi:hypothetical protein